MVRADQTSPALFFSFASVGRRRADGGQHCRSRADAGGQPAVRTRWPAPEKGRKSMDAPHNHHPKTVVVVTVVRVIVVAEGGGRVVRIAEGPRAAPQDVSGLPDPSMTGSGSIAQFRQSASQMGRKQQFQIWRGVEALAGFGHCGLDALTRLKPRLRVR